MDHGEDEAAVVRFDDPEAHSAAEVVYFHARGSSERETGLMVPAFPKATLRGYRGPIPQGDGFAWFKNRGIGEAEADSLRRETARVRDWIGRDGRREQPWLCGFSNGAAMAANLVLEEPDAYKGLVMLNGCFGTETLPSGRLASKPVLFCWSRADIVIPREKTSAALDYLGTESGADLTEICHDYGHEVPRPLLPRIATWFRLHAVPSGGGSPS